MSCPPFPISQPLFPSPAALPLLQRASSNRVGADTDTASCFALSGYLHKRVFPLCSCWEQWRVQWSHQTLLELTAGSVQSCSWSPLSQQHYGSHVCGGSSRKSLLMWAESPSSWAQTLDYPVAAGDTAAVVIPKHRGWPWIIDANGPLRAICLQCLMAGVAITQYRHTALHG